MNTCKTISAASTNMLIGIFPTEFLTSCQINEIQDPLTTFPQTPIVADINAADTEGEDQVRSRGALVHEGCCYTTTGLGNSEEGAYL